MLDTENTKKGANSNTRNKFAKNTWKENATGVTVKTDTQKLANGLIKKLVVKENNLVTSLMIL